MSGQQKRKRLNERSTGLAPLTMHGKEVESVQLKKQNLFEKDAQPKESYVTPKLIVHGRVEDITEAAGIGTADGETGSRLDMKP